MTEQRKVRRLSDIKKPGRDYPAKVKIADVLDQEVEITDFDHVIIMKNVELPTGEKMEVEEANYYNVTVKDRELIKTFSTGAQPIVKVLAILAKDDLPLLATFRKAGQTYTVE